MQSTSSTAKWSFTETSSLKTCSSIETVASNSQISVLPRKHHSCRGERATVLFLYGTEHQKLFLEAKTTYLVLISGHSAASLENSCKPDQFTTARVTTKSWTESSRWWAHQMKSIVQIWLNRRNGKTINSMRSQVHLKNSSHMARRLPLICLKRWCILIQDRELRLNKHLIIHFLLSSEM